MLSYKYYSTADVVGFSIAINCLYAPQNEVPIWRGLTSIDPKEKLLAAKCTNDLYLPSSRRHLQSIRLSFYTLFSIYDQDSLTGYFLIESKVFASSFLN